MSDVVFSPPQGTAVGVVLLCSNTLVLNAIVLPATAGHVPTAFGANNAFWAGNSGVGIGWTYDGVNFTCPQTFDKLGNPLPIITVPVAGLTRIILAGT